MHERMKLKFTYKLWLLKMSKRNRLESDLQAVGVAQFSKKESSFHIHIVMYLVISCVKCPWGTFDNWGIFRRSVMNMIIWYVENMAIIKFSIFKNWWRKVPPNFSCEVQVMWNFTPIVNLLIYFCKSSRFQILIWCGLIPLLLGTYLKK